MRAETEGLKGPLPMAFTALTLYHQVWLLVRSVSVWVSSVGEAIKV